MVFAANKNGQSDIACILSAIAERDADGIVVIGPKEDGQPWLIDSAILLPENTTVIVRNCTIKLSDRCRDNFFRSANCGMGIEDPQRIRNLHIIGEGNAILLGADHPRATGDGGKILANPCPYELEDLSYYADWIPEERRYPEKIEYRERHDHSYGTDFGKEGQSQYGDWRGIGILFANVEDFSVENLKIKDSHGWGISIEAGTNGWISRIDFDARMSKVIDGMRSNIENQDGIDIRNGCSNITISDITGCTGDDVVALTAIASKHPYKPGGSIRTSHVMHNDWERRDRNIHDITIRNIRATSNLCWLVRLLAAEAEIWNIVIDGVQDTAEKSDHYGGILIGEPDGSYGVVWPDSIRYVTISNVIANCSVCAIGVKGYLTDSTICNVINRNPDSACIYEQRENGMKNVHVTNVFNAVGKN